MDTRTSLFVVSLFAFVVAFGWATSEHGLCDYDLVRSVLAERSKDGAVSCFDFWFNRYQTFAAALIAFATAALALKPAFIQMREMQLQTNQQRYETLQKSLNEVMRAEDAIHNLMIKSSVVAMALETLLKATDTVTRKWALDSFVRSRNDFHEQIEAEMIVVRRFVDEPSNFRNRSDYVKFVYAFSLQIGGFSFPNRPPFEDVAGEDLREDVENDRPNIQNAIKAASVIKESASGYWEAIAKEGAALRKRLIEVKQII